MNAIELKELVVNRVKERTYVEILGEKNEGGKLVVTTTNNFYITIGNYVRIFNLDYSNPYYNKSKITKIEEVGGNYEITLDLDYSGENIVGKHIGRFKLFTTVLTNISEADTPFIVIDKPEPIVQINELISTMGTEIPILSAINISDSTISEDEGRVSDKIIYDNLIAVIELSKTPSTHAEIKGFIDVFGDMIINAYTTNIQL